MPIIILKANPSKIKNLKKQAIEHNLNFTDFTNNITIGTYIEQIELTKKTREENLEYYGIFLFGNYKIVSNLIKKIFFMKINTYFHFFCKVKYNN